MFTLVCTRKGSKLYKLSVKHVVKYSFHVNYSLHGSREYRADGTGLFASEKTAGNMSLEALVVVGNPGSGKSTILNSFMETIVNPSGIAQDGASVTKEKKSYEKDGITYIDTPGLSDAKTRSQMAKEIEQALKTDKRTAVVCILRGDGGRVNSDDLTTAIIILRALYLSVPAMKGKAYVVLNRIPERLINTVNFHASVNVIARALSEVGGFRSIYYIPLIKELQDEDNKLFNNYHLRDILKTLKSDSHVLIPATAHIRLDSNDYSQWLEYIAQWFSWADNNKSKIIEFVTNISTNFKYYTGYDMSDIILNMV